MRTACEVSVPEAGLAVMVFRLSSDSDRVPLGSFEEQLTELVAALRRYDGPVADHVVGVGSLCRHLAKALGYSDDAVAFIECCGLLHDIGKLLTPRSILHKTEPLTAFEWERMRAHAAEGAAMLALRKPFAEHVPVVRAHHERFDGHGYPDGLAGDEIPREARIVAVADAFDAMISGRPYRSAMTPADAFEQLRGGRGTQFDGDVVDAFLSIAGPRERRAGAPLTQPDGGRPALRSIRSKPN